MKQKTLSKIEQQVINEFKKNLIKKLGSDLVLIKLYGSKARGDWHEESDIDILVVAKGERQKIKNLIYTIAYDIETKYNYAINIAPAIYTLNDYIKLNNPPTSFLYTVNLEGKNIWRNQSITMR